MISESNETRYGTMESSPETNADPISTKHDTKRSFSTRFKLRMISDVDLQRTHLILICLFFVTGLVDSAAYNIWSCFVSMQTGNTVFVGLGVSNSPISSPPFAWTKSLVAIICFMIGALCFSIFHRKLGPLRKGTLVTSFLFQATITLVVAILVATKVVSHHTTDQKMDVPEEGVWVLTMSRGINWKDLAPISLLAFQAAGQIVASRCLRHNDLPTAVVTSMLCDMMSDAHLLTGGVFEDSKRNRRTGSAVLLFLGAIVGGVLTRSWVGLAGVLFIAATLKALIVLAWLLWPQAKEGNSD